MYPYLLLFLTHPPSCPRVSSTAPYAFCRLLLPSAVLTFASNSEAIKLGLRNAILSFYRLENGERDGMGWDEMGRDE